MIVCYESDSLSYLHKTPLHDGDVSTSRLSAVWTELILRSINTPVVRKRLQIRWVASGWGQDHGQNTRLNLAAYHPFRSNFRITDRSGAILDYSLAGQSRYEFACCQDESAKTTDAATWRSGTFQYWFRSRFFCSGVTSRNPCLS